MKNKYISLILSFVLVVLMVAPAVSAAETPVTRTTSSETGIKYLSWCKNTITWTSTSTQITSSDAWQKVNGIYIKGRGATKLNMSNDKSHYYNFKYTYLLGLDFGGVTLGYAKDYIDQGLVNFTGLRYWDLSL